MDLTDASVRAARPETFGHAAADQVRRIQRRTDKIFKLFILGVFLSLILVIAAMCLKHAF